ncbi:MAG: hypothetical protein WCI88_08260 [Chloroflexota bacterium]
MLSNDEITNLFDPVIRENQEISLINVYKGFPISYPGTVMIAQHGAIKIKTNPYQIVCIFKDKKTYIRYVSFPNALRAELMKIELSESLVVLSKFEYAGGNIGDRRQVRVEPEDTIKGGIKIIEKKINLTGEIADISLDGLAVYLLPGIQTMKYLREGTHVSIHLQLPSGKATASFDPIEIIPQQQSRQDRFSGIKKPLTQLDYYDDSYSNLPPIYKPVSSQGRGEFSLEGYVSNIVMDRQMQRHRVGVRLSALGSTRAAISRFILQRQTAILNEIRTEYNFMTQEFMNKP